MLKLFFISFSLFAIICNCTKPSYIESIFGAPGFTEVENDYVDGIEIVQTGLPHPEVQSLYNKGFTETPIEPSDYPWPDHPFTGSCTWALLQEETNNIRERYVSRTDLTQEELFKHPAAAQNFYTTDDELIKSDRVKIKFSIQPNYRRHFLPAFIPPGEVVTIEIPEYLIGSLSIDLNQQASTFSGGNNPSTNQKLNNIVVTNLVLNRQINKIGLPYGATVSFQYGGSDPIEVIVSGVILQPYFYYGMTSDEEWENDLSKRPGPIAHLDTGNLVFEVPSKFIRDYVRMNDVMYFWRSIIQISQTTVKDRDSNNNPKFGRIINPHQIRFDQWVGSRTDAANNFCRFTTNLIPSFLDYSVAINSPVREVLRELNFHHNSNWGLTNNNGESNDNALNTAIFALTNLISSARKVNTQQGDWMGYTNGAQHMNNHDSYPLARYTTLIHMFGVHKFRQFVRTDSADTLFPRSKYGNSGAEMLKASHVFKRDMHYHWNFHNVNDDTLNSGNENALDELAKMNLKPFHPVTNWYAVGCVVDDEVIITARPYQIIPAEQTIDFVSTMVQREDKEKFGDFEFQSAQFEKGRESSWKEVSKGVYTVKPKGKLNEIEEVNVSYLDKTTNEIHVVVCQFNITNNAARFRIIGNIPTSENTYSKAYTYVQNYPYRTLTLTDEIRSRALFSDYINGEYKKFISIYEGMLSPDKTGNYVFALTTRGQAAFYLSEEPLTGDLEKDEDKMINFQPDEKMSFVNTNTSKTLFLYSNKIYYFRHISLSRGTDNGETYVGYQLNQTGSYNTVPSEWLVYQIPNEEEMFKKQFRPKFDKLYMADEWNGQTAIKAHPENWECYKLPKGEVRINTNNHEGQTSTTLSPHDAFTDDDPTTEYRVDWWPSNKAVAFPHIYEIDMGGSESFKFIQLGKTGNMNFYPMNCYLQIYLAPHNYSSADKEYSSTDYSIDHEESLIWEGFFDNTVSETIEFDKEHTGRYIRFKFLNNSLLWKDSNPGRTCISKIEIGTPLNNRKIYPLTNDKYTTFKNRWDETRGGCYYNGKGFTGYAANAAPSSRASNNNNANSVIEIKIPKYKPEFGIIGDYYPTMGRAVVKIDGVEEGIIGEQSLDLLSDSRKLKKASRSYKSLLFYKNNLDENKPHTMTIEVTKGSVTLTGILTHQMVVQWNTDDERYPLIMKTEFNENPPKITDWTTPAKGFDFNSLVPNEYELPDDLVIEVSSSIDEVDMTNPPTEIQQENPTKEQEQQPTQQQPTQPSQEQTSSSSSKTEQQPPSQTEEIINSVVDDGNDNDDNNDNNDSNSGKNNRKDELISIGGIVGIVIAFIAVIAISSGTVLILYKKNALCFRANNHSPQISDLDDDAEQLNDPDNYVAN